MKTITYLEKSVNVPENWDEVTLEVYESFYKDKPETPRDRVALVSRICSTDPELILNWPSEIFVMILDITNFLWVEYIVDPSPSVKVDGVTYTIQVEEKLTLGEYIDADSAVKESDNALRNLLSIVCRPYGEKYDPDKSEERVEMFAKLPMSQVQPLLSFFLHCKNVSDQHTKAFSCLTEAVELLPPPILLLRNLGAGINLSQIWRIIKYTGLIVSLRYQLRKLLRSFNTPGIRITRKGRSVS